VGGGAGALGRADAPGPDCTGAAGGGLGVGVVRAVFHSRKASHCSQNVNDWGFSCPHFAQMIMWSPLRPLWQADLA
jgi:hypothetical protein